MDDAAPRCWWAVGERPDPLMLAYHDVEWGMPVDGDAELFERLALEGFQAGLSWQTILRKREAFREAPRLRAAVVAASTTATGSTR
jgi:DNA-3-methyladenine glycosylase I